MDLKILEINSVNHGSTGSIMRNIALEVETRGDTVFTSCQKAKSTANEKYHRHIYIGSRIDRNIHLLLGKITGKYGLFSKNATKQFIGRIEEIRPDIIHIHNLHKGYINVELLFDYIRNKNIPVIWTLHDCWAVTGQCPYFDRVKCEKWKKECGDCPQYREYPSLIDSTRYMLIKKREWFRDLNMTIVTPSKWLADIVEQSHLMKYPVSVIYNGIDLNVFKPEKSNLRRKYNIEDKTVILGVASIWDKRKGLEYFLTLSKSLGTEFQIILIGLSESQKMAMPQNIIALGKTQNATELAQYYSAADIFFNPTVEDNFPTVNIEALACGTPVFTFNTGGSPECLVAGCGKVVSADNMVDEIMRWQTTEDTREKCIRRSKDFSASYKYSEYYELYHKIYENEKVWRK